MSHASEIYEIGEVNYDNGAEDYRRKAESVMVASDILNEILETALDIVLKANTNNIENKKMNIIDEEYSSSSEYRDIIEGLSRINISGFESAEEQTSLDDQVKMLLNEMMTPPLEVVHHGRPSRKDGVGDQPPPEHQEVAEVVGGQPQKAVEKKSRITDMVMNSRLVLSNLLDEEQRRRRDDWEEKEERLVRVIELQEAPPADEEEEEDHLQPHPDDQWMDPVDLCAGTPMSGEGDDLKTEDIVVRLDDKATKQEAPKKKKKWGFSFKFFAFRKNRNKTNEADK